MKKLAFISGALFSSMSLIGILFEFQHWPGAAIMLFIGILGFALIFIPSFAKYQYSKDN